MFNSSKIGNSTFTNNTSIYNNLNETANGISRSFTQPKITSTPLIKRESIFATPPKHSLLSPKRYSLSEIATPPRSNRRDLKKAIPTGPLLASTRYDVNVSTYEDTKSPGLAGRIVQYNEESERERERTRPATHQVKYGVPGLFPVVHLFKKKLPTLEQRPRRVTVRIASPEHSRHHSQEYNRKLFEGIVKPSIQTNSESSFSPSNISSSSTRSVLDALKEISRKRIHANEEYDLNEESGKRLRTMNNGDTNKRLRDDSSMEKSPSPGKPSSKRVCMYDEYAASCSSMDFSFKKMELPVTKRKSVSISTITENPKDPKQLKLKNAETQTVVDNEKKSLVEDAEQENVPAEDESKKKKSPLKVFDDAPLERIRKNRLAALMGSLTGKDPVLLPKPDYASVLNSFADSPDKPEASESPKSTEKPLVSILKRSPIKSNKQVHFEVPESTSETNLNSTAVSSFPSISSSTVVTPLVSSASDTSLPLGVLSKSTSETPAPPSSPVNLQPTTSSAISLPVSTFESGSSVTSVVSKESSTTSVAVNNTTTELTVPTFQFKAPTTSTLSTNQFTLTASTTTASSSSVTSSPPKMGGFKFDLSNPVASTTSGNVTPTFSFGSSQSNAIKPSSDFGSVATSSIKPIQGSVSFGAKSTAATTSSGSFSTTTSFGSNATTTAASSAVSTTPTFKFGASIVENKTPSSSGFSIPSSAPITFNAPKTTTSTSAFGIATSTTLPASATPSTTVSSFGTTNSSFFSFGAPKTTSAPSGFGVPASAAASPITFGAPSTTSSSFGTPTSSILSTPAPSFGATTTSSALNMGFGTPTTTTAAFGSNTNSVFGVNKVASPFGVGTSGTPSFGTPSTTAASSFGKSATTQLGQSTMQSAFGTPTASMSFGASNAFGGTTTTTSSVFGGSSTTSVFGVKSGGFGSSTNNSNIFGGAMNTQPSGFGTATSKPMFGTATTAPFGGTTTTTAASSFGNSNTPSFNFGAKTTAPPSFGSSFGTTTTASSGFGTATSSFSSANSSFGSTNSFGSGNAFGATPAPAFGIATTTTQSSGFGTTNTPSFGNAGFNSTDKASMFGSSSTPAFGSNTSSPFGTSTSTPAFGTSNNTSGFGNSTTVSAFGKPQTAQNAFGAAAPNSFGASNSFGAAQPQAPAFGATNTANTQNPVFSFGATTSTKPPGVYSFGAGSSNEVPKPSFNFTGGNAAPPAFGGGATPSFGIAGQSSFGAGSAPQFNAPATPTQGMFSIGSGSSTGKARTHLKPKRRT